MDMSEIKFELLTDARKVHVNGVRFDVVTHVDSGAAEGVHGRLYWKIVEVYER